MTSSERVTQTRVGLFMLLGLVAICAMVVYFGRFGEGLKKFYDLRVEYPNASGLFKGADVLLAGAKVGAVKDGPFVLDNMRGVYVILRIREGVQIPQSSAFAIGSAGLLGDSFVEITMPPKLDIEHYQPIAPGSTVVGVKDAGGIAELAGQGGELVDQLKVTVKHIDTVVQKLNNEVLTKETIAAVSETMQNVKTSTAEIKAASDKFGAVVTGATDAMNKMTEAVSHITKTADKTTDTLAATKDAAISFDKTMKEIRLLVQDARNGKGALGTLVGDRAMAQNLQTLVANLRRYGILWYKDRPQQQQR